MHDITLVGRIQDLLKEAGVSTKSIATDEDGNNHEIQFKTDGGGSSGIIYTGNGTIAIIEGKQN